MIGGPVLPQADPGTINDIGKRSDIDGLTGLQGSPVGVCQGVFDIILGNFVAVGDDRSTGIAVKCQISTMTALSTESSTCKCST